MKDSQSMLSLLSIIAIGFFLGMRHATDPDHVIAVTTIVSNQRKASRAALIGVMWGLGHTVTILVVGAAIILFNLVIPVRLGLTMELSVGFMLILLGIWNLYSFMRTMPASAQAEGFVVHSDHQHSHPHAHGDYIHNHPHVHDPESHPHSPEKTPLVRLDRTFGNIGLYQLLRPLVVGIVHGLAGSAAVALLILASIRTPSWAVAYLLVFGVGTIAGMMLITMSIASTFRYVGNRFASFSQRLGMVSGLVSLAFGLFLAYEIVFVQGLLSAHPQWTPH
jgi:ABC-type nickel/cobalt efflux system permease component RcnA